MISVICNIRLPGISSNYRFDIHTTTFEAIHEIQFRTNIDLFNFALD